MKEKSPSNPVPPPTLDRRSFIGTAASTCAAAPFTPLFMQLGGTGGGSLTKEVRDRMTPAQVIEELKKGNERFRTGKVVSHDYRVQQKSTAAGQYPAAVVLGCVDSRAPAEILFDSGIGDAFIARVAGNVVNDDILG